MAAVVRMDRKVWVPTKGGWSKGLVKTTGKRVQVQTKDGIVTCDVSKLLSQKHGGRVHKSMPTEVIPQYKAGRPERFRVPDIKVQAVPFTGMRQHGDWGYHLGLYAGQDGIPPQYEGTLVIYNENLYQQRDKTNNFPGGGNAIARPMRPKGLAIGIPTGESGGFQSLSQVVSTGETVLDVINEAFEEIAQHILANLNRFHTIYYSEGTPGSKRLGTRIFNVGDSVIGNITQRLLQLSQWINYRAISVRKSERYA